MSDDISTVDEFVAYMAVKHNLIVPRNDPIIVGMLFNDVIQQKHIERISAEFVKYQNSLTEVHKLQEAATIQSVHKIMDECNAIAKKAIEESAKNAAAILKIEIQNQTKSIHLRNEQYNYEVKNSKRIALFSAAIALLSMLITVFIFFK